VIKGVAIGLALLAACSCSRSREPAPSRAPVAAPSVSVAGSGMPRLDDAAHDLAVLDADVAQWRERATREVADTAGYVSRVLARASVRGQLEDYVEADRAASAWVAAAPRDPRARVLRAQVDQRIHEFAHAKEQLAIARELGATDEVIAPIARAIEEATGGASAVLPELRRAVDLHASAQSVAALAMGLADAKRVDEALALMPRAWELRRGPSPVAAATLLFQWGRMHEEAGELALARDRYAMAYAAVPQHADVAMHLAGTMAMTGDRDAAIEVLERLLAEYPYPEAQGALAKLLRRRDPARAQALAEASRTGWARWLAALPAAFAHHAPAAP
jgi:tetratricopeptide (TPR) repeat protein